MHNTRILNAGYQAYLQGRVDQKIGKGVMIYLLFVGFFFFGWQRDIIINIIIIIIIIIEDLRHFKLHFYVLLEKKKKGFKF